MSDADDPSGGLPEAGLTNPFSPPPVVAVWLVADDAASARVLELLRMAPLFPLTTVDLLEQPPTAEELCRVGRLLEGGLAALLRTELPRCGELALCEPGVSEHAVAEAMACNPELIARPVVMVGDRAMVPRPPEAVFQLLVPAPPAGRSWDDVARRLLGGRKV